jgi:hypothetical protein
MRDLSGTRHLSRLRGFDPFGLLPCLRNLRFERLDLLLEQFGLALKSIDLLGIGEWLR